VSTISDLSALHHYGVPKTSTCEKSGVVKEKTTLPLDDPDETVKEWQLLKKTVLSE